MKGVGKPQSIVSENHSGIVPSNLLQVRSEDGSESMAQSDKTGNRAVAAMRITTQTAAAADGGMIVGGRTQIGRKVGTPPREPSS